jgi:hypothetical protein
VLALVEPMSASADSGSAGVSLELLHHSHIPQFENALLDIQYCSFSLFYRLVAIPRSTGKRTGDLFLIPLFDIHRNYAMICIK